MIFTERLPPPRMIQGRATIRLSTEIGRPSSCAKSVPPPIIWPVSARVSSAEAKDRRETPISSRTA